jgi:hypothetical protein
MSPSQSLVPFSDSHLDQCVSCLPTSKLYTHTQTQCLDVDPPLRLSFFNFTDTALLKREKDVLSAFCRRDIQTSDNSNRVNPEKKNPVDRKSQQLIKRCDGFWIELHHQKGGAVFFLSFPSWCVFVSW